MSRLQRGLKAAAPYAFTATVTALSMLQTVSALSGCAPAVTVVSGIALEAIQMAQTAKQNQDDCLELAERISEIMIVIATPYAQQKERDVSPELSTKLDRLANDLQDIKSYLERLQKKNLFKSIFFSARYERRIQEFFSRLNWVITIFQVDSQIENAMQQYEMGSKIKEIHTAIGRLTLQSVPASKPMSLPLVVVPPKPEVFYGRDDIVEDIVQRISHIDNARLAILGPGGLGKTSVALAVMGDTRTIARFGDRRYWVPCVQATSVPLLVGLIARSLKLSESAAGHFEQILSVLQTDDQPKILLLDNFETPWDLEEERGEVEDILCALASVPQVSLVITMRSDQPPSSRIQWTRPLLLQLNVLGPDVARQLYLHIDPSAGPDPALDKLLQALSYMPLAVTLMANRGLRGESPTQLLTRWEAIGTRLLHQGRDRSSSVQISVKLSIESNTMKNNPDALSLLSILSKLPGGALLDFLPTIAPRLDTAEATFTLLQASLAYLGPEKNSIHVLSPIQFYVQQNHPPSPELWEDLFNAYLGVLKEGGLDRVHRRSSKACRSLAKEVVNVEAVLKEALTKSNSVLAIKGSLTLGWHQYYTIPNVGFMKRVLQTAEQMDRPDLVASCRHCLGDMERIEGGIEAKATLEAALRRLEETQNQQGVGECLWSLGCILVNEHRFDEAKASLERSMGTFKQTGDEITYFECLEVLSDIDCVRQHYDEARTKLEAAHKEFKDLKPDRDVLGLTETLLALGDVLREQGMYEEAKKKFDAAAPVLKELATGSLYYEGWHLNSLGQLYVRQGKLDEARAAFEEGHEKYHQSGTVWGAAECLLSLGVTLKQQRKFDLAERKLNAALDKFREIRNDGGVAQCLRDLAGVLSELSKTEEAAQATEEAVALVERLQSEGQGDCVQHFRRVSKR